MKALSHVGATTVNLVDTPDDLETAEHYEQVIVSVMNQDRETPEGFYAGPAYAILREQFRGREKEVRERPRTVLLSFGGSDPQGLTLKAARALRGPRPRGGGGGGGGRGLLLPPRARRPPGDAAAAGCA